MTESLKASFSKNLTSQDDAQLIRALVPDAAGDNFYTVTFEKTSIDYVMEVGSGLSAVALKSGLKIPVAMDFAALEDCIYLTPRAGILDLRNATGAAAKNAAVPELASELKKQAAPATFEDKPMTIAVFTRQPDELNFVMFTFKDTDVEWSDVVGKSGRNGACTHIALPFLECPFDENKVIIDLPRAAFMELYNKAKMEGRTELDLRDLTRRRDPDKTLEKRGHKPKF